MNTNRAVFLLSLSAFASAASLRATDPLLPLLAAEFAVTTGGAAVIVTAFAIPYGLLQVVYGPVGDRYGKYAVVCAMTLASALTTLACAFAPTLDALSLARFAAGATVGAVVPLSMAWIGDSVAYAERQTVMARFLIGQVLGIGFGQAGAGMLGEAFGWRAIFAVVGVLYVIVGVLLLIELRTNPATHRGGGVPVSIRAGVVRMAGLFRKSWARAVVGSVFVEAALMYGPLAFVAAHLQHRFMIGPAAAGSIVAAFALGGLMYALAARPVIARLGERGLALGGGIALGIGYFLLAFASAAWVAVPCMLSVGMGYFMLHSTLQVHATQMAPEARGASLSLFALCLFGGQSAGVWIAGQVVDAAGAAPVFLLAGIGLPLLGWSFRRRLKLHAREARPVS